MIKILISSCILFFYVVFSALISDKHPHILFATLVFTFLIGLFIFNKDKTTNHKTYLWFVVPVSVFFVVASIFLEGVVLRSLLYIIFIPFAGYLAMLLKNKRAVWLSVFIIPFFAFVAYIIFPNWFSFYVNKEAHIVRPFPEISLVDVNKKKVDLPKDKIIVLDFWTTSCTSCFKKFPAFEQAYLTYRDNPNVLFYSVNVPIKRDTFKKTTDIVKQLDYEFYTVYSVDNDSIIRFQKLKFKGYPRLYILKNNMIVYQGSLVIEKGVFIHSLEKEIKRALSL